MITLKEVMYKTIHRNKKSVDQIAEEIPISSNYLYRAGLPVEGKHEKKNGIKFPVEYLIPLMKATQDYSILKYIAFRCGFILVKLPRVATNKMDEVDMVSAYQDVATKAVRSLKEFLNDPSDKDNHKSFDAAMQHIVEESVSVKKYCDRKASGQFDLEL